MKIIKLCQTEDCKNYEDSLSVVSGERRDKLLATPSEPSQKIAGERRRYAMFRVRVRPSNLVPEVQRKEAPMSRIGLVLLIVLAVFLAGFANLVWGQDGILKNLVPIQAGECETPDGVFQCFVAVEAGKDDPNHVFLVVVDEEGVREIVKFSNKVKNTEPEVVWKREATKS